MMKKEKKKVLHQKKRENFKKKDLKITNNFSFFKCVFNKISN